MESVNDSAPRLTPEEADARAAALIAQYRDETRGSRRSPPSTLSSTLSPGFGWVLVYLAGVVGGAASHAKPMIAVLLGVPLVLIGRAFINRRALADKADKE